MEIGFIGLGIMGKPVAENLLKAGFELIACGINEAAIREVASYGTSRAGNSAQAAVQCEAVITMVPNSPQVRAVALGKGGIIEGAEPGTTLIDVSSIGPTESWAINAELAEKGIEMTDCPVSGGEPKAIDDILSVMCGSKKGLSDKYYDMLVVMAGSVVYVGGLDSGNVAKLADQIVVAVSIAAVSEVLTFVKEAGTDPELVYQAARDGLTGSTVMNTKAPMMPNGNYQPGFRLELHIKNLDNALNAAHAASASVPLTGQLTEMMQSLKVAGCEREDHSALVKYYEKIAGETVRRNDQYLRLTFSADTFIM